jgi:ABC-type tungstate transport system substrate-binding protein
VNTGRVKPALFLVFNMNEFFKEITNNRLAVTLIIALAAGMFGFYVNTITDNNSFENRLTIVEAEIQTLKIRQGQLEMQLYTKADQSTIDVCLRDLNTKLDGFNTETNKRFDRVIDLIMNIKK